MIIAPAAIQLLSNQLADIEPIATVLYSELDWAMNYLNLENPCSLPPWWYNYLIMTAMSLMW